MPPVYWDGMRMSEELSRTFLNKIGPLNGICLHCGGSILEVKSVNIRRQTDPLFRIWCSTCGRYGELYNEIPLELCARLIKAFERRLAPLF